MNKVEFENNDPSPLINGSDLTNFVFRLKERLSEEEAESINSICSRGKVQDRLAAILSKTQLEFSGVRGGVYKNNLRLVDSDLEQILAHALLMYYMGKERNMSRVANALKELNPCGYDQVEEHPYYSYKLKKLLVEHALGMVARDVWSGEYHATGGYIIVREDGELVSYHLMKKNLFEDYLFHNTKFDTMSTNPKRGNFAYIYEEDGEQFFALNLMVKFLK